MKSQSWYEVWQYIIINIKTLAQSIPSLVFVILAALFLAGFALVISHKGVTQKGRGICLLLLVEYLFLVYCTTVYFRPVQESSTYSLRPFWWFQAFLDGQNALMAEKILNVVMFVPIGLLMAEVNRNVSWYFVLSVSILLSIAIEVLQFVLQRGVTELDDVIHNSIGALIGYGLFSFMVWLNSKLFSSSPVVDGSK